MFYACSINLCGRFVTLPDFLTLGICSIILGVCSALAEVSAAGVVSCTTISDSSTVVVAGRGSDDEPVDGNELDGKDQSKGGASGCLD